MSEPKLTLTAARHLHLAAQGLLKKPRRRPQPGDILRAVQRMSLLQIDTINVVARSPYLVLFSRLGAYPVHWLDEALSCGELMEYWAHEACFLPRNDFALVRHRMLAPERMGWKYSAEWMSAHQAEISDLLEHIHHHGPVRSADFQHPGGAKGWWAWKPHKRHLEGLFTAGKLMVVGRHNFQRIYDLTARVMPDWDDERDMLPQKDAEALMLRNSARSLGIFDPRWLADYYRLRQPDLQALRRCWLEEGVIQPVRVDALGEMWLHEDLFPLLEEALAGKLTATHSAVLSPFDPLVWDRKRARQLFGFTYRLECYTPAAKRQYGYFVLPLLHRGRIVGRMDSKMLRKEGVLAVMALFLENDIRVTPPLEKGLAQALEAFACWQGARRIMLMQRPPQLFTSTPHGWEIDSA